MATIDGFKSKRENLYSIWEAMQRSLGRERREARGRLTWMLFQGTRTLWQQPGCEVMAIFLRLELSRLIGNGHSLTPHVFIEHLPLHEGYIS